MTETHAERLSLARHFLTVERPDRALESLTGAEGALEDPEYWELRAAALLDLERDEEGLRAARQGLALDGESLTLLELACIAAARTGDLEGAERAILSALRLAPDDSGLLCQYAHLLARAGQLDKARRVLERAEREAPDEQHVLRTAVFLAYLRGDDREAKRLSERLLEELDPEDPLGHSMLATYFAERGSARRASQHLDTAARYDVRDHAAAAAARRGRVVAHWIFMPLWPFERFGPAKVWVGAIAGMAILAALGLNRLLFAWVVAYVALCAYSWVVPPIATRLLERRGL